MKEILKKQSQNSMNNQDRKSRQEALDKYLLQRVFQNLNEHEFLYETYFPASVKTSVKQKSETYG